MSDDLLQRPEVRTLVERVRAELSASFVAGRPVRLSRAPGRLDVMGGIADYTGSLVCEMPLDRAAAVALQPRDDRQVQVMSFNLLDEHQPFTLQMSLDDLAAADIDALRHNFNQPGRKWAGYLIGCLAILHEQKLIDLTSSDMNGMSIALYSSVPLGAGVSSSAAVEVATMMNLVDHFELRSRVDAMRLGAMCQQVENRVVGAPCGIMDQIASSAGVDGALMRLLCQPHQLQEPLFFPDRIRAVGINSNVKHSVGGGQYGLTRCAAFMGHTLILDEMKRIGEHAGRQLIADPMKGYLANLEPADYKQYFRARLPETMTGVDFLAKHTGTIDTATVVDPATTYHVQAATDHHVLEARRVREFVRYLSEVNTAATPNDRKLLLDKAGHLMYASHVSYGDCARLGAEECDLLVDLVRANESGGLYGAKITGGGSGGTVAVLCDVGPQADATLTRIMTEYEMKTGLRPDLFNGSSPGAWAAGTVVT
jgi:galactokinase